MNSTRPGAVDPPKNRNSFLVTPIGELADLWLIVTCAGCRQVTYRALGKPPFVRHRDRSLHEIFSLLRCSHCSDRASAVRLTNSMRGPVFGSSAAVWDVALLP